jgi:N-formylglutamate amidohydrolase
MQIFGTFAILIDAHEMASRVGIAGRGQLEELLHLEAFSCMPRKTVCRAVSIEIAVEE